MKSQHASIRALPGEPGVYKFIAKGGKILYIGKATSLKSRVQSYFSKDLIETRGPLLVDMVFNAHTVEYIQTDSVLEALILEAELIKRYQPKYNTKEKDNKSFNYVCITNENLPKVIVIRGRELKNLKSKKHSNIPCLNDTVGQVQNTRILNKNIFGPFTNGSQLREALKIIRRIFPFYDDSSAKKQNYQFYKQLALIPTEDYKNNLKNLALFFQGKKKRILQNLKKQMTDHAKRHEFERANEIKKQIFALRHINDVALIKDDLTGTAQIRHFARSSGRPILGSTRPSQNAASVPFRIEAYDIAHMLGKNMVGVMTVIENGQVQKNEYRKFNIKGFDKANDPGALAEVLERRFKHNEWAPPQLIVVDGNQVQIHVAETVLKNLNLNIPVVSVVKDDKHKAKAILNVKIGKVLKPAIKKSILLANNEAHRFAITFHKLKRSKAFLPSTKNKK